MFNGCNARQQADTGPLRHPRHTRVRDVQQRRRFLPALCAAVALLQLVVPCLLAVVIRLHVGDSLPVTQTARGCCYCIAVGGRHRHLGAASSRRVAVGSGGAAVRLLRDNGRWIRRAAGDDRGAGRRRRSCVFAFNPSQTWTSFVDRFLEGHHMSEGDDSMVEGQGAARFRGA